MKSTPRITLSRKIAQAALLLTINELPPEVVEKVKIALLDMLSCAFEARNLPWSRQAIEVAGRAQGKATVIGTPVRASVSEAAFVNAIMGHGLVREDMHTRSVSHLGVVIFPTLLALAQSKRVIGRDFILGAVCGYEMGAAVGRAVMDQEVVRIFRPTGITGPIGGAVAGGRLLGLSEDALVSAIGLAANTTVGLNEWPKAGADEMFFQVGFAARNAVTAVELAELGAYISETALDGSAGLFAALQKTDRVSTVNPFAKGEFEIMSVFHKPAPACNYAQTPSQAALAVALQDGLKSSDIVRIHVKCSAAALNYPGCDSAGPFERILAAKMSIRYCVAATLANRRIAESNYRALSDPEVMRLVSVTTLEEDPEFTDAYPQLQGSEVIVTLADGRTLRHRLPDLIPANSSEIRLRFREAAGEVLGRPAASAIESAIDTLENQDDMEILGSLLQQNVAVPVSG
ncbi:MAG TPA: MmgE/PrpD family protein [Bryobacteraceae bacterium]|nr:MmgE/PrpD family protein [Bryobacteraceae bacterium]